MSHLSNTLSLDPRTRHTTHGGTAGNATGPNPVDCGAIPPSLTTPFTGGPVSYIDTVGAAAFVKRCDDFAAKYGERFKPNKLLRDMAAKNETFYSRFAPVKQAA